MTWRWHGRALPLEGDGAALILTGSRDHADLRLRAARVVRKMLQHPAPGPANLGASDADPLFRDGFVVSDGIRFFTLIPIVIEDGSAPLLMFAGAVPPPGRDLAIVQCSDTGLRPTPSEQPSVICFTPGTRLLTERGMVAVEEIGPGTRLLTRDNGPQAVIWTGQRRMSGARLFAMPSQRPIRIRTGALGKDRPDGDLVVSPEHRILVGGAASRDLWDEAEVLVRAADLVGAMRISVDHSLRETTYIHIMLTRHEVICANGLSVETFHPAYMGLSHLDGDQLAELLAARPDLAETPDSFGAPARRMVSRAEAAILAHGAATRPLMAEF